MKQIGMTWQVHPEQMEPYVDIHLDPWPELLAALQEVGIHNYNIFKFGNRMFAFLEVESEESLAAVQEKPIMDKWNEKVLPWVMPSASEGPDDQFLVLERIFFAP